MCRLSSYLAVVGVRVSAGVGWVGGGNQSTFIVVVSLFCLSFAEGSKALWNEAMWHLGLRESCSPVPSCQGGDRAVSASALPGVPNTCKETELSICSAGRWQSL